jgi:uncharacterized membrane protein YuzA (DUF378 family)
VARIFGNGFVTTSAGGRLVYGLVGAAAVYPIAALAGRRRTVGARTAAPAAR